MAISYRFNTKIFYISVTMTRGERGFDHRIIRDEDIQGDFGFDVEESLADFMLQVSDAIGPTVELRRPNGPRRVDELRAGQRVSPFEARIINSVDDARAEA